MQFEYQSRISARQNYAIWKLDLPEFTPILPHLKFCIILASFFVRILPFFIIFGIVQVWWGAFYDLRFQQRVQRMFFCNLFQRCQLLMEYDKEESITWQWSLSEFGSFFVFFASFIFSFFSCFSHDANVDFSFVLVQECFIGLVNDLEAFSCSGVFAFVWVENPTEHHVHFLDFFVGSFHAQV